MDHSSTSTCKLTRGWSFWGIVLLILVNRRREDKFVPHDHTMWAVSVKTKEAVPTSCAHQARAVDEGPRIVLHGQISCSLLVASPTSRRDHAVAGQHDFKVCGPTTTVQYIPARDAMLDSCPAELVSTCQHAVHGDLARPASGRRVRRRTHQRHARKAFLCDRVYQAETPPQPKLSWSSKCTPPTQKLASLPPLE